MANLQVRNIPDELHERLRRHAREHNCTMSAVVLSAVERELVRWEWRERLAQEMNEACDEMASQGLRLASIVPVASSVGLQGGWTEGAWLDFTRAE